MERILVIDDDHLVVDLIAQVLVKAGFSVVCARNGRMGLDMCRLMVPNAVLTDLVMPEMDGLAFISAVKKEFPKLPVIAMSGGLPDADDRLERAGALGACALLAKPFRVDELIQVIRAACAEAAAERVMSNI